MTLPDLNPYATPATTLTPPPLPAAGTDGKSFQNGIYLIVKDGAVLPSHCAVTNEPVPPKGWRKKVLVTWTPPWALAIILPSCLLGLIPGLLMISVFQKKANITYSLCPKVRWKKTRLELIGITMAILGISSILRGVITGLDSEQMGQAIGFGAVLLIGCLVMFIISRPIKPTKVKNGWFRIKGCSSDFLAALPKMENGLF